MKRCYKIGFILFFFFSKSITAQQVYRLSVKEAVDIAFKNVADIKNAKLDYKISDRKSTRLNSSHVVTSRMPSSA